MDKVDFVQLALAHSDYRTIIYDEVGISGPKNHTLPLGTIDLLGLSQNTTSSAVAMQYYIDGETVLTGTYSKITGATMKTYSNPGGDRQAIVELLALAQVLLEINSELKCCVLIKATGHLYRPYFYLPDVDMLLRTTCDMKLECEDYNTKLIGNFVLSLLMHHHFNYLRLPGWAKSYKETSVKYNAYIKIQTYKRQPAVPIEPVEGQPSKKRLAVDDFSDCERVRCNDYCNFIYLAFDTLPLRLFTMYYV